MIQTGSTSHINILWEVLPEVRCWIDPAVTDYRRVWVSLCGLQTKARESSLHLNVLVFLQPFLRQLACVSTSLLNDNHRELALVLIVTY